MFSTFQENWGWEYLQFRISTRNIHYYLKDDFSQPEKKFFPNYKILIILLGFSTKKACQRNLNSPFFFFFQQRHLVNSARDTEHNGKRWGEYYDVVLEKSLVNSKPYTWYFYSQSSW